MPIVIEKLMTRKGTGYVRAHGSGEVSQGDAAKLIGLISARGPFAGVPLLGVVDAGSSLTLEAREAFTHGVTSQTTVALVVRSAPMRVQLRFDRHQSSARDRIRFFSTEAEALDYLDALSPDRTPPFPR